MTVHRVTKTCQCAFGLKEFLGFNEPPEGANIGVTVMKLSYLIASAVAASLAAPSLARAHPPAPEPSYAAEKCYGINVRGRNDCASPGAHTCATEAQEANDPKSWIYVPAGTCSKITGGSLGPKG
jgi:uncharacterized membrane protein